jgi:hypothetical protein
VSSFVSVIDRDVHPNIRRASALDGLVTLFRLYDVESHRKRIDRPGGFDSVAEGSNIAE